jgi:5'-nucleotidase
MLIDNKNNFADKSIELYNKTGMIPVDSFSNQRKKILYIDMDGVVADFWDAILFYQPNIDDKLYFPTYADQEREVDSIAQKHPRIFRDLLPIKGAIEATKPLFDKFDVYFLSTPMWDIPESYTDKRLWLEKYYGNLAKKRLIITNRKDLAIGDILIDDRLKNGSQNFKGKFIHFGTKQFPDWKAVIKHLNIQTQ